MDSRAWTTTRWLVPWALVLLASGAVPAAIAAPPAVGWNDPVSLTPSPRSVGIAAATLDAQGAGVVVWNACTRVVREGECPGRFVNESRAFRDGAFERIRRVAFANPVALQASAARGGATTRWKLVPGEAWRQSSAAIGQAWGRTQVSRPPEGGGASVETNAAGQGISAYLVGPTAQRRLVARYRSGAGENWGPQQTVAPASAGVRDPQVVIDRSGRASIIWVAPIARFPAGDAVRIKVSRRGGNGRYITTNVTNENAAAGRPAIGHNDRGDVVAAFTVCEPARFEGLRGDCTTWRGLQAAVRVAGAQKFQAPRAVSQQADGDAFGISATFSPTRRAMIVWNDSTGLRAATAPRVGGWTRITISGSPLSAASMAADATGRGVIAWNEGVADSGGQAILAAPFGPDGAVGPAEQVSGAAPVSRAPLLAVSDSGRALLVWSSGESIGSVGLQSSTTLLS